MSLFSSFFCSTVPFSCLPLLNLSIPQEPIDGLFMNTPYTLSKQFPPPMFSTPAYISDNYQISRYNLPPELQVHIPNCLFRPLPECPTCTSNSTCSIYLFFFVYFRCQLMAPPSTQPKQSLTPPTSSQPTGY